MKTYGKIYEIIQENSEENQNQIGKEKKLVVDVPGFNDIFFPYGRPNDDHLNENGYTITNPEFLLHIICSTHYRFLKTHKLFFVKSFKNFACQLNSIIKVGIS